MNAFQPCIHCFDTPDFNDALINTILNLDRSELPLQQALTQSSYVSDTSINVIALSSSEDSTHIMAKVGIFYFGIIAGSCCSDDPTPVDELQEYCELVFKIDKQTGTAIITLVNDAD